MKNLVTVWSERKKLSVRYEARFYTRSFNKILIDAMRLGGREKTGGFGGVGNKTSPHNRTNEFYFLFCQAKNRTFTERMTRGYHGTRW